MNVNNYDTKIFILLISVISFVGVVYLYGPSIVFYFDQRQGYGTITLKKGKNIFLEYFHDDKKKKYKIFYKDRESKLKELKSNMKVEILYSNRYPTCIAFLNYGDKPDLSNLITIIFCAIPIIFYKRLIREIDW